MSVYRCFQLSVSWNFFLQKSSAVLLCLEVSANGKKRTEERENVSSDG